MGFFKKIFKGIKKVFKKIGKGIKSAFKKVGKFMGKIGIVGQLGLALIMPYALPALGGLATGMMGTQLGGALGAVVKGAGHFLNAAVKVGTRVGTAFKSVTSAVTDTIGNMVGATINSLPGGQQFGTFMKDLTAGKIDITELNFDTAWSKTQDAWRTAGSDLGQLFSKSTIDSSMNKFGIQANLEESFARGDTLSASDVGYDPVTGERSFRSLDINDPNYSFNEKLGLGREGTTYDIGNMATKVDLETMTLPADQQLGVTVGGTAPSSSLLAPETMNFVDVGLDAGDLSMSNTRPIAADPFKSTAMDVSSYTPDASKVGTEFGAVIDNPLVNSDGTLVSGGFQPPKSLAARAGTTGRKFLKSQGVEMSLAGMGNLIDQYNPSESQNQFADLRDPYEFVDMSALQTSPIQSSPGLSTSNMMAGMGGYSDFTQIQQDILNSNFTNMYSQGYYGAPSLQAGLALAYEELAA
jgi:hypothetical protein